VVAAHVEERSLADDRVEEIGPHDEHVADEQPAVRSTQAAQVARRRDLALHEVLADRDEVLVAVMALGLDARFVPGRTERSAARMFASTSTPPGSSHPAPSVPL
jgi:hypothetical protein